MRMLRSSLCAVILLSATACQSQVAQQLNFERVLSPFDVIGSNGQPYAHPFFGGFDSPRPQLVDLNSNGFPDLAVQEVQDRLIVYLNRGHGAADFVWQSDNWQDLEIGSWFRFGDVTGNGLPDLLTNYSPSTVRLYANVGSADAPRFELAAAPLLDTEGRPLVAEDPNVPALADIDGDGRLDLFMGQADRGHIRFYRHTGLDESGLPMYKLVTNRFQGIEIYEANPTCDPYAEPLIPPTPESVGDNSRGSLHGENALTFADIDGDGTLDLFWGDFFTASLYYFRNEGSAEEPRMQFVAPRFPLENPLTSAGYNAPSFGDVGGTGTLDLVIGIVGGFCSSTANLIENLYLLENRGTPSVPDFQEATGRLIHGVDVGRVSAPVFRDLNGDGTLDLVIGSAYNPRKGGPRRGSLYVYANDGTPDAPALRFLDDDFLSLDVDFSNHYAPVFGDVTGDGRDELIVGTFGGRVYMMPDRSFAGSAEFGPAEPILDPMGNRIDVGQTAYPAVGDVTGDGRLEMIVGSFRGNVSLFRSAGSLGGPTYELVTSDLISDDLGRFTAPHLADLTGDGRLELLVGTERQGLIIYQNVGSPTEPQFVEMQRIDVGRAQLTPTTADLRGTGRLDIVLGTRGGGLIFLENRGTH